MITVYRFKVFNSIGNVFDIGRMAAPKEEVETFCLQQIKKAKENSPGKWEYSIELIKTNNQNFSNYGNSKNSKTSSSGQVIRRGKERTSY